MYCRGVTIFACLFVVLSTQQAIAQNVTPKTVQRVVKATSLHPKAASAAYSLGDLSLQNGWDAGIVAQGFTNNNANSDVVTNADAFAGTQSWRYSGSYGSPGSGTPFTKYVASVGAPNAASAFGAGLNSPVTPTGDQSVISFAFRAIAPGDGSQFNVYEGNRDLADPSRTGPNIYVTATSASLVTLHLFHLSSTDDCNNQDFPDITLATVAAGVWHTVKMTTTYPNVTPSNFATYGTTTFIIDEGTGGQVTVTDSDAVWVHQYNFCNGGPYSPGTAVKWSNSFNDYPTHQGFYVDNVSMKVNNTGTATTVAAFATSFEAAELNVIYDGNGNTGGTVPIDGNAYVAGDTVTVLGNTGNLVKTGSNFAGWNTAADGSGTSYAPGDTFVMGSADVTLFARWAAPADMSVTKIGPASASVSTVISYTITVTNNGANPALNASMSDTVPAGTTFSSLVSPGGWSCVTPAVNGMGTVTCTMGSMAAGSAVFTLNVNAPATAATVSNTALVSSSSTDPTPGNNSSTANTNVVSNADLSITKTPQPGPYGTSNPLTYTIGVTNAGPGAAASVVVTDILPAGTTFVSATPTQGSCSGTTTITCTLGTIANAGSAAISLTVTLSSSAGPVSNTATVATASNDPNAANNSATSTVSVVAASSIPASSPMVLLLLAIALAMAGFVVQRTE